MLIVLANRGLKFVVSANHVRIVNIYLAVFDLVFVIDPSSKSISPKTKVVDLYFLYHFYFGHFKFLYQNLGFGRSNTAQNQVQIL